MTQATNRPPAVAGQFYPARPDLLRHEVEAFLAAAVPGPGTFPKAVVAPHAGYVFSGAVAGSAFACIQALGGRVRRVVLLGPSHYVAFRGLALPTSVTFETPLGAVPVDAEAAAALADLRQVFVDPRPHAREHSLEVELPFLQVALGEFSLVPLAVGDAEPGEVAEVLERLWDGAETLIVVSTDLSHYLDYETARRHDERTAHAILALDEEAIGEADACGRDPLRGLLRAARRHGLSARELDRRNSGDTAGPRDRVVGYGAYAFA